MLRTIFMVDSPLDHKLSIPDRRGNIPSTPKSATIGATPKSRMLTPMRPICATIGSPSHSKQNKKTVCCYNNISCNKNNSHIKYFD